MTGTADSGWAAGGAVTGRSGPASAGMVLLLLGALITHRRAADSRKETAPALLALAITLAYLTIAVIG